MKRKSISKGILLAVSAVFISFALVSYDNSEWGSFWEAENNLCGPAGVYAGGMLYRLFGPVVSWMVPAFLLFWSFLLFRKKTIGEYYSKIARVFIFIYFASAFAYSSGIEVAGGLLASWTADFAELFAGRIGSILILAGAFLLSGIVLFWGSLKSLLAGITKREKVHGEAKQKKDKKEKKKARDRKKKRVISMGRKKEKPAQEVKKREEPKIEVPVPAAKTKRREQSKKTLEEPSTGVTAADDAPLPDIDILADYDPAATSISRDDLLARSDIIESKLADFGLRGEVKQVRPGPVVTTFEFVPAPGVRVSQIASRSDDLSLALAAKAIRIEAPIPGKGAVGIEIPNPEPQKVYIKEMLEHYPADKDGLVIALGKTVTGEPYFADISDMPHLLIAGATGSGKSVSINSIITSLLFNHSPSTCRFILIDPKRLELITYKGIPHLLHPVITETRDVLRVMNWLTIEMDRRYKNLARHGVKNISSYNRYVEKEKPVSEDSGEPLNKLPYIVAIIDELADIMVSTGNEIYPSITRLSQMARAVGIHLVFATQRPSVDVVTGLIKANFPSRIAFQVTSKTDSRTILDVNGAEKLLGNGDMLYLPKDLPSPVRIQGSYISERDAASVAEYWKKFEGAKDRIDLSEIKSKSDVGEVDQDDELFEQAKELVIIHQQGSISLIQRRLRVGYSRAARLIDMLEQAGVVGPFEGSKAREVLITREEYEASR